MGHGGRQTLPKNRRRQRRKFNARKTMLEKYIQKREQDISSANKRKKQRQAVEDQKRIEEERRRLAEEQQIKEEKMKKTKTFETNMAFVQNKLAELKNDDKIAKHVKFLEPEDLVQFDKDPCDKDFQDSIIDKQIAGVRS